jgi:hypothetical protein
MALPCDNPPVPSIDKINTSIYSDTEPRRLQLFEKKISFLKVGFSTKIEVIFKIIVP